MSIFIKRVIFRVINRELHNVTGLMLSVFLRF